jgi:hypothetical protein
MRPLGELPKAMSLGLNLFIVELRLGASPNVDCLTLYDFLGSKLEMTL